MWPRNSTTGEQIQNGRPTSEIPRDPTTPWCGPPLFCPCFSLAETCWLNKSFIYLGRSVIKDRPWPQFVSKGLISIELLLNDVKCINGFDNWQKLSLRQIWMWVNHIKFKIYPRRAVHYWTQWTSMLNLLLCHSHYALSTWALQDTSVRFKILNKNCDVPHAGAQSQNPKENKTKTEKN